MLNVSNSHLSNFTINYLYRAVFYCAICYPLSISAVFAGSTAFVGGITTATKQILSINVTVPATVVTSAPIAGNFALIYAESTDTLAAPRVDTFVLINKPYVPGATYITRRTTAPGIKFTPFSQTIANVLAYTAGPPAKATWDNFGTSFGIFVNAPTGVTEKATATWEIYDPQLWSVEGGEEFTVSTDIFDGWSPIFEDPVAFDYTGTFVSNGSAGTSIIGLENLYDFSISMDTLNPGLVDVLFSSNPLLGLDDEVIMSDILGRFSYDPLTYSYDFDSSAFELAASFIVPTGTSSLEITTQADSMITAVANVSSVPLPSAGVLLGSGVVGLLLSAIRRKMV